MNRLHRQLLLFARLTAAAFWALTAGWAGGDPLPASRFAVTQSGTIVRNSVDFPEAMRFRAGAWTPAVVPSDHQQIAGPPRVDPTWQVDQWRTEHGLPQNEVRELHQTRDGYLWIGTSHGLARFDGRRFVTFDARTDPRLDDAHQDIRAFVEDPDGTLWIGTAGGVLRWTANHLTVVPNPEGDGALVVHFLSPRNAGGLWVSTRSGLYVLQEDRWQFWSPSLGSAGRVNLAAEAPDGALVWSDARGLMFRPGPEDPVMGPVNDPHLTGAALTAHVDSGARLWLGLENGIGIASRLGIEEMVPPEIKWFSDRQQFTPALCTDSGGQMWIASGNGPNLHRWIGRRLEPFPEPERSRIHEVSALASDPGGGIWVGTRTSGLFRVRAHPLATLLVEAPIQFENVRTLTGTPDGSLWMGTDAGVVHWGGNGIELFDFRFTQAEPTIRTLLRVASGKVWAPLHSAGAIQLAQGIGSGGLIEENGAMKLGERTCDGIGPARVLYGTRNHAFWLGTPRGLVRWTGVLNTFTTAHGLGHNDVRALHQDRSGDLWVGTYGGGLSRMQDLMAPWPTNQLFETFDTRHGLSNNRVWAIHEDADGVLWLGTERGLNRLESGRFTVLTRAHGLQDDAVNQILEDDFGRYWIGSNRGLLCVTRESLNAVAAGHLDRVNGVVYGEADGMLSAETNGENQPAGWKSPDGRLWFPTTRGVVVVQPADLRHDQPLPHVVLEQMTADGDKILSDDGRTDTWQGDGRELRLAAGRARVLEIRYTVPGLMEPGRVRFEHRLDGFDADWRAGPADRVAIYTGLRPGRYEFQVRAINHLGPGRAPITRQSLRLDAHFWQTGWFLAGSLVSVAGLATGFMAWRLSWQRRILKLEEQHARDLERTRLARDLHDHLGASLATLALELGGTAGDAPPPPTLAKDRVRATLRDLNDLVWEVNPDHDTLAALQDFLSDHAERCLRRAGLEVTFDFCCPNPGDVQVAGRVRQQVAAAYKETLRNVLQHAGARRVQVRLRPEGDQIQMEIADDGCGFDPLTIAQGRGLGHVRDRFTELRGTVQVTSSPGQGTRVQLRFPIGTSHDPSSQHGGAGRR